MRAPDGAGKPITMPKQNSPKPKLNPDIRVVEESGISTPEQLSVEAGDLVRRLFSLWVPPQVVKPDRLLTAQEVAKLLNTNAQVVYRLARSQELPTVNLGERMMRFTELSVSEFINRGGVARAA